MIHQFIVPSPHSEYARTQKAVNAIVGNIPKDFDIALVALGATVLNLGVTRLPKYPSSGICLDKGL